MYFNGLIAFLSMTVIKISFISIWMLAIPVFSCWGTSSTNLGVSTPDPKLLVGKQLSIDCTIFNTTIEYNKSVYEVNSSMISFKFQNQYYAEEKVHIINETVAQLRVNQASVEDNGMYYCLLNISGLDHNPLVCVSHVTVGYKPQNVKDFKCISWHFRKLHCSWIPQYNPIATSYHLEDRMHATKSTKYDYLTRKCGYSPTYNSCEWRTDTEPPYRNTALKFALLLTGQNQFGKNEQLFLIDHYSIIKPNVPKNVRHLEVTTDNITVSWKPPEYIEFDEDVLKSIIYEIRYFRINLLKSNEVDNHPIIIDGIRETTYTLTNLIPFSSYNVSIRCKTIQSKSDEYWSAFSSILVTTKPDVPYLAPVLIPESFQTVKNTEGNRSITLFWKPIPIENRNSDDFHYSIEYTQKFHRISRATNSVYHNPINIKSENTTYTFNHMDSNSAYIFKIYGVNSQGKSDNYSQIIVDKNENIPHKPTNIDVFSYGGGRYEVQWGQPRDNSISGPILNYTVFWCQNLRPRPFPCEGLIDWIHTTNTSIALELPDISTNYQFAVSANALKSSSGMSWAECIVPIDGKLDKLSEVRLDVESSTSIKVIWKLNCPAQKRVVEGYKIIFCQIRNNYPLKICNQQKPNSVTVDTGESYTLTQLEPFSQYKITVIAFSTDTGSSEESDPKYATTFEDTPDGAPSNLKITETTSNSIALKWEPPLKPNGQIAYYEVLYDGRTLTVNASKCSPGCSHQINDLTSHNEYKILVRACNTGSKENCSPFSNVSITTLSSAPSRMDPPRTESVNATTVRISWSTPIQPNGPIDYYLLKLIWRDNKTESSVYNVSGIHKEYYLSLDCNSYKDDSTSYEQQYAVSIVAVNKRGHEEFVGQYSDSTHLNACLMADENEAYIIGIIVGGTLGLMLFVMVLYMLVNWMKKKINAYNSLNIELPKGLEAPQLIPDTVVDVDHMDGFDDMRRTDSSPHLMSNNVLNVAEDDDSFKNRHGSGISSSSTEGLIYRNVLNHENGAFDRMVSSDSGQHGSVSSNSYNGEAHMSSDSGAEIDANLQNSKDNNVSQPINKVSPKPLLPILDEISSRNSDSSSGKDSGYTRSKRKRKSKNSKNNKISTVLPAKNETINPLYDSPLNHNVCIYSLLANSEPSICDLPIREDDNILNNLHKIYKPEMAKSLTNIIQNSSPTSDPKMNCIICDSNYSSSKNSTRTASPNCPYYKDGVKGQRHLPNNCISSQVRNTSPEKKPQTKPNNDYIPLDSILNNSEPKTGKPVKKTLEHDWSQNSYDAEVSSTSSNGDNEHTADIIAQPNLIHKSSTNFSECEKIQNNSLTEAEVDNEHLSIDSSVNPLIISPSCDDMSSTLNSVSCEPPLSETVSRCAPPMDTKTPHNVFEKNSNGYVIQNAFSHLSANKVKPNLTKNANGYVVINDGIELNNVFVPNNNNVNHVTRV